MIQQAAAEVQPAPDGARSAFEVQILTQVRGALRQQLAQEREAAARERAQENPVGAAEHAARAARIEEGLAEIDAQLGGAPGELEAAIIDGVEAATEQAAAPVVVGELVPDGVVAISLGFFAMVVLLVLGWPIARAVGRRSERRRAVVDADPQVHVQLRTLEQAIEAIAGEVERLGEGQRQLARLPGVAGANGMRPGASADRVPVERSAP